MSPEEDRELSRDNAHTVLDAIDDIRRRIGRVGLAESADRAGMTPERMDRLLRYSSVNELTFRDLQKLSVAVGAKLEWRMNDEED